MSLKDYIEKWKTKYFELKLVFEEALKMLDDQGEYVERLEKENNELRDLISKTNRQVVNKTSKNSNRPPSKDIEKPKRTKSRKVKSKRKPGGQAGHKGHYLEMSSCPDKIKHYYPKRCESCNNELDRSNALLESKKQEIDIPPLQPVVTQYNRYKIFCSCGRCNYGKSPIRLKSQIQYGPRVRSLISYFSVYQYLPYKRLQDLLRVCFGLELSQGTIYNAIARTAGSMSSIYENIRSHVGSSEVLGADETVVYVSGKKWYHWVWQNKLSTYISCEPNRKKENITKHFSTGFPESIIVSDRYAAHLSTPAKGYQICWSHLLRKINYIEETEGDHWVKGLLKIYRSAKHLEELKTSEGKGSKKTRVLEGELTRLLTKKIDKKKYPETKKLFKSLITNREKILTFIYHKNVPSHNNASELAIRNAKVKMKISGCFRSGQHHYAIIRSVIDTMTKNGMDIFENLFKFEKGQPINFKFS